MIIIQYSVNLKIAALGFRLRIRTQDSGLKTQALAGHNSCIADYSCISPSGKGDRKGRPYITANLYVGADLASTLRSAIRFL